MYLKSNPVHKKQPLFEKYDFFSRTISESGMNYQKQKYFLKAGITESPLNYIILIIS